MKNKKKKVKANGYSIYIGDGVHKELSAYLKFSKYGNCKAFILVDENTKQYCLPILQERIKMLQGAEILEIKSKEENKTLKTATYLWTELIQRGAYRDSYIINLGGGIICDIGGFSASIFKRGIPFINVPTTLLAQVDASIGGKTAVDFYDLKNQIGLFSNPEAVFVDPTYLSTLPHRQLLSGFGEVIKHALIRDEKYWNMITKQTLENVSDWYDIIHSSIVLKNKIIKSDPTDTKVRKKLNFGHTIGHAIESLSLQRDADPLLHGEAVAIGIICESYLSFLKSGLQKVQLDEITGYTNSVYPFYKIKEEDYEELVYLMLADKKNKSKGINFTLLKNIGSSLINNYCTPPEIIQSLDYYRKSRNS